MLKNKSVMSAILALIVLGFGVASSAGDYVVPAFHSEDIGAQVTIYSGSRVYPLYWPETRTNVRDLKVVFETPANQLRMANWWEGDVLDEQSGIALVDERTGVEIPADKVHHVSAFLYDTTRFLILGYKDGTVEACIIRQPKGVVSGFWCAPTTDINGLPVVVEGNAAPTALMMPGWGYPILLIGDATGHAHMYWMNEDLKLVDKGCLKDMDGNIMLFGPDPNFALWDISQDGFPDMVVGNALGELILCNGSSKACWALIDHNTMNFGPMMLHRRGVPVFNNLDWTVEPELYIGGEVNTIEILR